MGEGSDLTENLRSGWEKLTVGLRTSTSAIRLLLQSVKEER